MNIVWSSFDGRYSDSPRALYERLRQERDDLDHVWLAREDVRHTFPRDAVLVPADGTGAARAALEAADLVVASSHIEVDWDKRAGTTYVQTWHGTPLKTVHWDVLWAPEGRLEELDVDVARWDLLLSPNAHATRYLSQAFRWEGELLESGYPRNDVLSPSRHDRRRAEVRAGLGIDADATVVLYAPTWRDAEGYDTGMDVPVRLDLDVFSTLADDHVLLLRAHNLVAGRWDVAGQPWLRDVSLEPPDMADLFTAADVLVTDYSSAMFDWTVTGRPILYLAADLEQYASQTRGFYVDLFPEVPGPVLTSTEELVAALRDLPALEEEHAERYAAFRERFTPHEDGHATDRVLRHLGLID